MILADFRFSAREPQGAVRPDSVEAAKGLDAAFGFHSRISTEPGLTEAGLRDARCADTGGLRPDALNSSQGETVAGESGAGEKGVRPGGKPG